MIRPFRFEVSREFSASSQVSHGRSCVELVVAQSSPGVVGICCFIKVVTSSLRKKENQAQWEMSAVLLKRVLVMSERHFADRVSSEEKKATLCR